MAKMHASSLGRATAAVLALTLAAPAALAQVNLPGQAAPKDTEKDKTKVRTDALGDPLPPGAIARLGTSRLRGCQGPVMFSPDGKYIITAGGNGGAEAIFWDIGSGGRRVKALKANGTILQLAFSPDGKQLAAAVNGGNFCPAWDVATGKQRFTFTGQSVAFSADGKKLISTYGHPKSTVRFYDAVDGKQQTEWTLELSCADNATLSLDGRFAVAPEAGREPRIRIIDLQKKIEVKALPFGKEGASFSRDGRRLVACGSEGWTVWDWASGKSLGLFWSGRVYNIPAFSPDGRRLAWIGADDERLSSISLRVVDLEDGRPRRLGATNTIDWRHPAAFSDDGKKLAVVTRGHAVALVDSRTGQDLLPLDAHTGQVYGVDYFAEGRYLLTGELFRLLVWEAATGRLPDDLPPGETILRGTVSHGRIVTAELTTGILRLRDLVTAKELRRLKGKDSYASSEDWDASAVSTDGSSAAILGPAGVRIYDLNTGDIRCQITRDHLIRHISFSADDRTLEMGIEDPKKGALSLFYDAKTGRKVEAPAEAGVPSKRGGRWPVDSKEAQSRLREMKLLDAAGNPAFTDTKVEIANVYESSDGRYLAVEGWTTISPGVGDVRNQKSFLRLWDTVTRRHVTELDGTHAIKDFSPDGRMLLSLTNGPATIYLWETATGRERMRLAGHLAGDVRLCFRPDGRVLISGGDDTQVFLWDLTGRAPDGVRREIHHSPERLGELWQTLAGDDAAAAYRAIWSLVDAPAQTVAWMREQMPPVAPVEQRELMRRIAELDSDEFTVRSKASEELERLGELAESALRDALAAKPTLERRRRCEDLLAKLAVLSSRRLRAVRAVEALEQIGTAEARTLLEKWSQGAPQARLTQEAKVALQRFSQRGGKGYSP